MINSASLIRILLKSSLLASFIFCLVIADDFGVELIYLVTLTFIPIVLVCSFTILVSIVPIIKFGGQDSFVKYFPYYSISVFMIFTYFLIDSNFDEFLSAFTVSAFFTLMQAWVWLSKNNLNKKKRDF